jgi:hypothetical protein
MKKLIVLAVIVLSCLGIAQQTEADFPAGVRIIFSDGTSTQLSCTQDGNCRVVRNTSALGVAHLNLGFSMKHGYVLNVQ